MTTDKPRLLNAAMVRATLDGRKTQTRQIIKDKFMTDENGFDDDGVPINCPFGVVGGNLWVRETFGSKISNIGGTPHEAIIYRAGTEKPVYCHSSEGEEIPVKWTPSIHMPRWASRINLKITNIRVERLQDISEEDAIAEGLKAITKDGELFKYGIPDKDGLPGTDDLGWPWHEWCADPRDAFKSLWDSIYAHPNPVYRRDKSGKKFVSHYVSYPWEDVQTSVMHKGNPHYINGNPWVWVADFKRVKP